jgi:hypothetical protein
VKQNRRAEALPFYKKGLSLAKASGDEEMARILNGNIEALNKQDMIFREKTN